MENNAVVFENLLNRLSHLKQRIKRLGCLGVIPWVGFFWMRTTPAVHPCFGRTVPGPEISSVQNLIFISIIFSPCFASLVSTLSLIETNFLSERWGDRVIDDAYAYKIA